jgi:hemoglobin
MERKTEGTLYERLGGYDTIAAIVDNLFARLRDDPQFARFATGRSFDSYRRARQLLVDQLCSLAGGPCFYIGRDMKTSHAGLGITESEWEANWEHACAALNEFLSLFARYRGDIVESSSAPPKHVP